MSYKYSIYTFYELRREKSFLGYYRVNYDLKNWNLLIEQLNNDPNVIHVLNRGQLIDDAWALAIDNKLPFSVPIAMTRYLTRELDVLPWYSAIRKFEYVYSLFENTGIKELLRVSIRK